MSVWFQGLSDVFLNLSAGWFGAALILPMTIKSPKTNKILLLGNILCGILAYVIGILLK